MKEELYYRLTKIPNAWMKRFGSSEETQRQVLGNEERGGIRNKLGTGRKMKVGIIMQEGLLGSKYMYVI